MAASSSAMTIVPVGLAGLARISPAGGRSRASSWATVGWKRVRASHGSSSTVQPERAEHVAVGGVAGTGHDHGVADVEGGQERQQETAGRTGGDDDVRGVDVEAGAVAVVRRDRPAQRRDAERRGVADAFGRRGRARRRRAPARGQAWTAGPADRSTTGSPASRRAPTASMTRMTWNGGTTPREEITAATLPTGAGREPLDTLLPVPSPYAADLDLALLAGRPRRQHLAAAVRRRRPRRRVQAGPDAGQRRRPGRRAGAARPAGRRASRRRRVRRGVRLVRHGRRDGGCSTRSTAPRASSAACPCGRR